MLRAARKAPGHAGRRARRSGRRHAADRRARLPELLPRWREPPPVSDDPSDFAAAPRSSPPPTEASRRSHEATEAARLFAGPEQTAEARSYVDFERDRTAEARPGEALAERPVRQVEDFERDATSEHAVPFVLRDKATESIYGSRRPPQ